MPRTLKDQLEAQIADAGAREAAEPGHHDGRDWWQLTGIEEQAFQIDRERFPRMMMTWHCYEAFKHIALGTIWDEALLDHARRQFPQWCGTDPSEREFQDFAKEFAGLTFREAALMHCKHAFWLIRAGATHYADEAEK